MIKNGNFDISDKEHFGHSAVKRGQKMRKSHGKQWKILRLIYIVLIFLL